MRIYVDPNIGNTFESLKYLEKILNRYSGRLEVIQVIIDNFRIYSFEIHARDPIPPKQDIFILLSGLNCGYYGTGPHGSLRALQMLGIDTFLVEPHILSYDICMYHRSSGWTFKKLKIKQEVKS